MNRKMKKMLAASENRATFFARVELRYSRYSKEYQFIEKAYNVAKDAFRHVVREDGTRYFEHVRAVAIIQMDYLNIFDLKFLIIPAHEVVAAALLHDTPEDCPEWPLSRIELEFSANVAWLLDYVSKRPRADFGGDKIIQLKFYHDHLRYVELVEVFLIKLPDRWHNQLTLWSCKIEKIERKNNETIEIYIPLARQWNILFHELVATTEDHKERLTKHMNQCVTA
ncbi:MAG: HD domain-containing protein [Candidatus Moraniibacteriota bacterium]|jgi:GTP diphosphokinase / guanosine-3',5'-bis(diphosphate) 3'-diphosphatase